MGLFQTFGILGFLGAVWDIGLRIWSISCTGAKFVFRHALAAILGSKFWATGFFVSLSTVVIGLLSSVITYCIERFASLVFPDSVSAPSSVVRFVSFFFPINEVVSLLTFAINCFALYESVVHMDFSRRALQRVFTFVSRSWKT